VKCRACGAEIAEKAIVCYRCGAPTATPQIATAAPAPKPWLPLAGAVVAAGGAFAAAVCWPAERVVAEMVGGGAAALLALVAVIRWPRR
jgi:hypothetical protein